MEPWRFLSKKDIEDLKKFGGKILVRAYRADICIDGVWTDDNSILVERIWIGDRVVPLTQMHISARVKDGDKLLEDGWKIEAVPV